MASNSIYRYRGIYSMVDAVVFFFLYQVIWPPIYISINGDLRQTFTLVTKIITIGCIGYFIILSYFGIKKWKPVLYCFIIMGSLLLSTVLSNGDMNRCLQLTYPAVGTALYFTIVSQSWMRQKIALKGIALLFWVFNIINLADIIIHPDGIMLSDIQHMYFWGGENQVELPMIIGLLFVILANQAKVLSKGFVVIYLCCQILSLLIVFSGFSLVSFCICLIIMVMYRIPPVSWISRMSLNKIFILIGGVFLTFFFLSGLASFLNFDYVRYVIEELLGKDTTLSGRTEIWDTVVREILERPFLGNGVRETYNLFRLNNQYLSAHNQLLQSLYEGGVVLFIAFIPLVNIASKSLRNQNTVAVVFKAVIVGVLVMYMGEAIGLATIIMILVLAAVSYRMPNDPKRII